MLLCSLVEDVLVLVCGNEYYLDCFVVVFCLSVLLYGFDGEVLGVLDIIGIGECDVELLYGYFC